MKSARQTKVFPFPCESAELQDHCASASLSCPVDPLEKTQLPLPLGHCMNPMEKQPLGWKNLTTWAAMNSSATFVTANTHLPIPCV